jgi:hypothetical protein
VQKKVDQSSAEYIEELPEGDRVIYDNVLAKSRIPQVAEYEDAQDPNELESLD